MPTYDIKCEDCEETWIANLRYDERDMHQLCEECKKMTGRRFYGNVVIRSAKLSKTFIDKTSAGGGRPDSDGFDGLKKAAELEVKNVNIRKDTEEYRQNKKEIKRLKGEK